MKQEYIDLYDEYTHGTMPRRSFLDRLVKLAGGSAIALALLPELENNYAAASTHENDELDTGRIEFEGKSGQVKGYLAMPKDLTEKIAAVVVIHENKGLNPHIEDVARRAAREGYIALAPDALSPLGGTPTDMDEARSMIGKLDREKTIGDFVAAVRFLKDHKNSNGNVGCVGFCWGGSMANQLAVNSTDMKAAAAFYGSQPDAKDVPKIKGAVLLHYAGLDDRINAGRDAYIKALQNAKIEFETYTYEGVNHAFHNDTNAARYNSDAAKLAWQRTVAFWKRHLGVVKNPSKT